MHKIFRLSDRAEKLKAEVAAVAFEILTVLYVPRIPAADSVLDIIMRPEIPVPWNGTN